MSDVTLNSSLYQQISEFAELVDEALLGIVINNPKQATLKKVADKLQQIAQPEDGQLVTRMLAQILLGDNRLDVNDFEMIINAIEQQDIDEVTKSKIEILAQELEHERALVMARIRGNRR